MIHCIALFIQKGCDGYSDKINNKQAVNRLMRIIIRGTVQGVGFRPAVYRTAVALGVTGTVRNSGSDVVIEVENADGFINELKKNLPPLAVIDSVSLESVAFNNDLSDFTIIDSSDGDGGVGIPTDTAICEKCVTDIADGRRKDYGFTSCTDCGARFTLISDIPYDRKNTSMNGFRICPTCNNEYSGPKNRRFHHQTVCCPECGPQYRLTDGNGRVIDGEPIETFAGILDSGKIGVAKSWGGMHICALPEKINEMREWYGRPQKPFAVMVRDVEAIGKYAEPGKGELEQLLSPQRPIVLVKKVKNDLTERISPGLDSIGLFLPYTAMQHILFKKLKTDALIMTSANLPGEPMILDDDHVLELGADAYLLHNQRILNRADDSVIRVDNGIVSIIRKSRGHIPSYITVRDKGCVVGLGAHENITASVAVNGRIHSTQHIGDGNSFGIPEYLETASRSLMRMLKCKPSVVALDLHPRYSNRSFGYALGKELGAEVIEIQHHWAHAASLLVDNDVKDAVVLSVDGTGYGDDGNAWGGEVLRSDLTKYKRLAHLQNIPLLGSEKALYDLRRLKFAIDEMNGDNNNLFDDKDSEILRKMMSSSVRTSSFGRVLDALAFTLGVCTARTYDGEPAMKIESLLSKGKLIEGFETERKKGEIMTAELFSRIKGYQNKSDVAYSIVKNILDEMVNVSCDDALSKGVEYIGITGGVSYNGPICSMVEECVKGRGLKLLRHRNVPNGDGGISVGQAAIALRRIA